MSQLISWKRFQEKTASFFFLLGLSVLAAEFVLIFLPVFSDRFQTWLDGFYQLPYITGPRGKTGMATNQIVIWYLSLMAMFLPMTGLMQLVLGNPESVKSGLGFSMREIWVLNLALSLIWAVYVRFAFFTGSRSFAGFFLKIIMDIVSIPLFLLSLAACLMLMGAWFAACNSFKG